MFVYFCYTPVLGALDRGSVKLNLDTRKLIWANQPIHSFLVECLNPCLQGTTVVYGLVRPSPRNMPCVSYKVVSKGAQKEAQQLDRCYILIIKKSRKLTIK